MITSIRIQGLRGIRDGQIDGLAPLTMIVGPNGCGKSTVLEALGVACAGTSPSAAFEALATREWLGTAGMKYWFDEKGADVDATFEPNTVSGAEQSPSRVRLHRTQQHPNDLVVNQLQTDGAILNVHFCTVDEDGCLTGRGHVFPGRLPFAMQGNFVDRPAGASARFHGGHFSSALRSALTAIKLSSWYDDWFKYLQELRPNVTSIESIAVGDRDEPHLFEGKPRIGYPLAYAGDGFRRALLLAGAFARAKGGVAAIDEPEVFAHPGMFGAIASLMRLAVHDGTQVVFATHSLEFIATALRVFEDEPEKVAVIGLRMEAGVLDPVVIEGPDAKRRVLELGHDVRL
jgi:hypothetical protein